MDARTNINARFLGRHPHEGLARAHEWGIDPGLSDIAEVFKKTLYIADLKPAGRYVAKDMIEVGGIPLLMTPPLDHGHPHGDRTTATGRTIAENLKSVTCNSNQKISHADA